MINLNAVMAWTARAAVLLWFLGWPIAYAVAVAQNTDLSSRLETRTSTVKGLCSVGERTEAMTMGGES